MEPTAQEKQIFTLDGVEYNLDETSDTAKACILHIQKLDAKIAEVNFELDEVKIARMGYISILKGELDKQTSASAETPAE